MNKLRTQIVVAVNVFLLVVLGGMMLFYFFFAQDYYIMRKKHVMNDAFETIRQFDLNHIGPENEEIIESLEEESFAVLICNDSFESVYSSKIKEIEAQIRQEVVGQSHQYTENAQAQYLVQTPGQPIVLYGLISQGGNDFYVYISENTRVMSKGVAYANHFLLYILIIALIFGTVFAYFLARWIVKPVEKIQQVTNRLSQNDFSVRIPDRQPNNEVGKLAQDINCMAEKIQRNMNDLSNYNYLLLSQNRDMAEFEEMRKKMVGNITHELKTPLAIISSQVELLQYEYDATKKEYYFSSIMEEIDKMSLLISTILQNSRMEHQIGSVTLKETDLSAVLEGLLPKYQSWLSTGGISFAASIESGCVASADEIQIGQAVNNFMMNAKRHTRPGGSVQLSLMTLEDGIEIAVYNEGELLPESEIEQVWTSFYQTGRNRTDAAAEIGLGLYIVKDIVKRHGGSCGVRNRQNGVEFWMKIPKEEQI